jgi:serine phosphatase RsbU (regulator of sigma subunit)
MLHSACTARDARFLGEGGCLLLYTDGLSEARCEGRLFGEEGILAAALQLSRPTAKDLAEHVLDAALRHAKAVLRDDAAAAAARLAHSPDASQQ